MAFSFCPLPAELQTIPLTDCDVDFDQVVRMILVRKTATPIFTVTAGAVVITAAALTALLTADEDAKGILTPRFSGLTFPETEAIIEGENDNTTVFGAGEIVGGNVVRLKCMFTSINSATAQAIYPLIGERNLTAIFITKDNQIVVKANAFGFPIYNQFLGDVMSEGLNKKNKTSFSFTLRYGWSLENGYAMIAAPVDVVNMVQPVA